MRLNNGGWGESAKFWMVVLTELRNHGVAVFLLVCDGLKGLPDSVNAVWFATIVQTCLIHLIRNSFRFASRKYWDGLSRDLNRAQRYWLRPRPVDPSRERKVVPCRGSNN
jgi:transposase-like protein